MASRYINERDRTLYGVNYDLLDGLTLTENGFPVMDPLRELPKVDEVIEINRVITNKGRPGNQGVLCWWMTTNTNVSGTGRPTGWNGSKNTDS